jgi:hypothetical protein
MNGTVGLNSILDDYSTFRRVYENPILKSRTPDCTGKEKELGESRSKQVKDISSPVTLGDLMSAIAFTYCEELCFTTRCRYPQKIPPSQV